MPKYQPYPEYKESTIEWAAELPTSWKNTKLKWLATSYAGGTPSKVVEEYWENGTIPWLNSGAVNEPIIRDPSTYITEDAYKNSSAKWIPKGSLVMALAGQGKTKATVAQLAIDTTCNQSMAAIVPSKNCNPRFLFWWLNSNYQNIRNLSGGDLRDGLNLQLLSNIECPLPSSDEQSKIVSFLDTQTTRIDTLIQKKTRFIELLKEKRQALISHAVTKGLDPKVPMKYSGADWLGDIPKNWTMTKIKNIANIFGRIGYRGYTTEDIVDEGEGAITLSPSNLVNGKMAFDKVTFLNWEKYSESPEIQLNVGDIVMVKTGSTYGRVAYVDHLPEKTTLNPQLIVFKDIKIDNKYFYYLLISSYMGAVTKSSNSGGTMPTMSQEAVLNIPVVLPLQSEQQAIIEYIDCNLNKIDKLVEKTQQSIALLKEHRVALISAAVTGKIDVRNHTGSINSNNLEVA